MSENYKIQPCKRMGAVSSATHKHKHYIKANKPVSLMTKQLRKEPNLNFRQMEQLLLKTNRHECCSSNVRTGNHQELTFHSWHYLSVENVTHASVASFISVCHLPSLFYSCDPAADQQCQPFDITQINKWSTTSQIVTICV